MNDAPLDKVRRIIPRWRDSRIALTSRELISSHPNKPSEMGKATIYEKQRLWREQRQVEFAAELVSCALSQGFPNEAIDAAEFILAESSSTTPAVVSVAQEVLLRAGKKDAERPTEPPPEIIDPPKIFERIHLLRILLNEYPRNALAWADLSQAYATIGQLFQSQDAMNKAFVLSPDNRFILRSAARLYIHIDDPDRAHYLLASRPITVQDPWLLAAEIATANVAGKTSKLIRFGKDILERGKFPPFHTAELASALATLEFLDGSWKKARKLFQLSLKDPNENSVAQSTWVRRWLPTLETDLALIATPKPFEARVWNAIRTLDWSEIVTASQAWSSDEPFSSRPAELGSYAASVGLENYPLAETICHNARIANPHDYSLINNLAFALANQGKLDEADALLKNISRPISDQAIEIALTATEGLVSFRRGSIDAGQTLYLEAISLAEKTTLQKYRALASINYSREMLLVGRFTRGAALRYAEDACGPSPDPDIAWLLDKLKALPSQGE